MARNITGIPARGNETNLEQLSSYEAQVNYYTTFINNSSEYEMAKVYADEGISGIGVIFEKEKINTLDSKGEVLLTILSSLALDESRSINKNSTWGLG